MRDGQVSQAGPLCDTGRVQDQGFHPGRSQPLSARCGPVLEVKVCAFFTREAALARR